MSQESAMTRSQLFAVAVTAITAVGLIIVPAPAQALPACLQFGFPGDVTLRQADGWNVSFSSTGSLASGPAQSRNDKGETFNGTVAGSIEGRKINVVTTWDNGPRGLYTGEVGDDYHMSGTAVDISQGHAFGPRVAYRSVFPVSCLTTPDPPKQADPPADPPANPGAPSKTAFVGIPGGDQDEDVDVYDVAGGDGNITGILQKDKGVQVNADCQPDSWCLVRGAAVPGGQGWIWGHLRFE